MLKLKPFFHKLLITHFSKNNFRVNAITLSLIFSNGILIASITFFLQDKLYICNIFLQHMLFSSAPLSQKKTSVKHSNLVWPVWYLSSRSFWCRGHTPWLEGGRTGRRTRRPALSSVGGRGRAWWSYCEPFDSWPSVWPLRSWWDPWSLV